MRLRTFVRPGALRPAVAGIVAVATAPIDAVASAMGRMMMRRPGVSA